MGEDNGVKPGTFMASRDRYIQHKNKHAIIKTKPLFFFLKKTKMLTLNSLILCFLLLLFTVSSRTSLIYSLVNV